MNGGEIQNVYHMTVCEVSSRLIDIRKSNRVAKDQERTRSVKRADQREILIHTSPHLEHNLSWPPSAVLAVEQTSQPIMRSMGSLTVRSLPSASE